MVLLERVHAAAIRKIASDWLPGFPAIGGLEYVGLEIAPLMIVDNGINSVRIEQIRFDVMDVAKLWDVQCAEAIYFAPCRSPILRDLHQTFVGADIDQSLRDG